MGEIGQEDIQFDDIPKAASGGLGHGFEVVEHAADLHVHAAFDQRHGGGVQRNLAGQINRVADFYGLGVGADRFGSLVSLNNLFCHGSVSF